MEYKVPFHETAFICVSSIQRVLGWFCFYLCSSLIWGDAADQLQLIGSAWSGHLCALLMPAQGLRWTHMGGSAGDTDLGCAHVSPTAPLAPQVCLWEVSRVERKEGGLQPET